jgi:hypothetical protein
VPVFLDAKEFKGKVIDVRVDEFLRYVRTDEVPLFDFTKERFSVLLRSF